MSGWTTAAVIALVTFAGVLATGLAPRFLTLGRTRHGGAWSAVAAGLLLASALVIVIPEGFEVLFLQHAPGALPHTDKFLGLPPVLASGLAIWLGFTLMLGLETRGMSHEIHQPDNPVAMLSIGLGLHAVSDGLALGASVATGLLALTLPILAAVLIHKIPVAFSLGVFLWRGQENHRLDPLRYLVLFSLATPLGLLVTFLFLRHLPHEWIGLMLLFSGGTFLYVATVDILARLQKNQPGSATFWRVVMGMAVVIVSLILFDRMGLETEFHGQIPEPNRQIPLRNPKAFG